MPIEPKVNYNLFYQRQLPHYQPEEATFFVIFWLVSALPGDVVQSWMQEKSSMGEKLNRINDPDERLNKIETFRKPQCEHWDKALDCSDKGPIWLEDRRIATMVTDEIKRNDNKLYRLIVFCIMPNQVHLVCQPLPKSDEHYYSLAEIPKVVKGGSAIQANKIMTHLGAFWEHESYDHAIRDEAELQRIIDYGLNNPVKAGLVDTWNQWEWTNYKYA